MSDPTRPSSLEAKAALVALATERKKVGLGLVPNDPGAAMRAEAAQYEAWRREQVGGAERTTDQIGDDFGRSMGRFAAAVGTGLPAAILHEGSRDNIGGTETGAALNDAMQRTGDRLLAFGAETDQNLAAGMSEVSRLNEAMVNENMAQDFAENREAQDARIAEGGSPIVAKTLRFGADIADGALRTVENPTYLSNQVAGQAPTLLIGPAANMAARLSVSARAAQALAQTPARQAAARAGMAASPARTRLLQEQAAASLRADAARTYAGVGGAAMESSAVYGEGAQAIMAADINQLAQTYPDVAEQLQQGLDPNDIKHNLIRQVVGPAALAVAPIGFVMGKATAGFELDPLMLKTGGAVGDVLPTALGRVAGEIAEESAQGGGAELASNFFEAQASGNENADLLDGVGGAIGMSIPTSAAFTAGLSAPALGMAGAVDTVKGIGQVGSAIGSSIGEALSARADVAREEEQAVVREQAEMAAQTRRDTLAVVDTSVQAAAASPEQTPAANALVEPIESEALLDPEMKATLAGGGSRVQALSQVIDNMRAQAALPEDQRDGTQALNMMLFTLKTAGQLRSRLTEIAPDSDEANAIQRTLAAPEVTEIEEQLPAMIQPEVLAQMMTAAIAESPDFASPTSQRAAEQIAVLAEVAPDTVSSEAARSIALYQRLAPEQKAHLETVAQVAEVREAHAAAAAALGKPDGKTIDIVTQEVKEHGMSDTRPSLATFQRRILGAMVKGDVRTATKNMTALLHFARHYQGKASAFDQAMQQSATEGRRVNLPYEMVDGNGKKVGGKAYAWHEKEGSQNLVDHVFNDANTVAELYNTLATTYPQLVEKSKSARTPLVPSLSLPGEPQFRSSAPVAASTPTPAPTPTPTPTPVETTPAVSRVTSEQAKRLSDAGLNDRINALMDKRTAKTNTAEDDATFDLLDAEMTARETSVGIRAGLINRKGVQTDGVWADEDTPPKDETGLTVKPNAEQQALIDKSYEFLEMVFDTALPRLPVHIYKYLGASHAFNWLDEGNGDYIWLPQELFLGLLEEGSQEHTNAMHGLMHETAHTLQRSDKNFDAIIETFTREYAAAGAKGKALFDRYAMTHAEGADRNSEIYSEIAGYLFSANLLMKKEFPETSALFQQSLDRKGKAPTPTEAEVISQARELNGDVEAEVDFGAEPTAESAQDLEQALAMSEKDYLAAVNPDGKATEVASDEAIDEELADTEPSSRATVVREIGDITLKADGDYLYAVRDGETVGLLIHKEDGTTFMVATSARGQGLGKAMMRELLVRKPMAKTNGLSPAAQATRLAVLRDLRAGQAPAVSADNSLVARLASVPKFLATYSPREGARSLMARVPLAMRTLSKAIKQASRGDLKDLHALFLDQKISLSATQVSGLDQLINSIVPEVIRQLNANLERSIVEGKRFDPETGTWLERTGAKAGGWLEALVDGKQDVGPAQFSAAVLEYGRDEAGKPYVRYQAEVAQAMALASLQWTLKQVAAPINFDKDELAALYPNGMPKRLEDAYRTMHFAVQPTRTIASDIIRMLGMQGNKDASVTLTDGIAKSMALDVITALHDADVLALRQVEGTEAIYAKNAKTGKREAVGYKGLTFIDLKGAAGVEIMKTLRKDIGSSTLQRLLDPEGVDLPTFAPVTVAPTKVSGTEQMLSKAQQKQVLNTNATKSYRNPGLLLFVDRMGDRFLQLLGKDLTDLDTLHPDYAKTVKGVNDGLDYALEQVRDLDMMLHEHAPDAADNTALYWSHYVVSNGRVMQNGFGGQGDKQARDMFSANRVTGDLSTDQVPLAKGYYLSLAQALGIKTEKRKNAAAVAEIRERLAGAEYQALFLDIQTLQRGEGDLEALADSIQSQMAALLTKPGKPTSTKAIHALLTHARLLEARSQGTANEFTTYLGFELDGKTNGPINAIMHFGLMGKKALALLRKGGLFVDDEQPHTLSDFPDQGDLYSDVATESEVRIGQELVSRELGSRESNMLKAGLRMLTLANQISINADGSISVTRDMAKAGMVPTTYGSGARGVANQMASDIQASLVKYLSMVANGEAELDESIVKSARYIMSQRWIKNESGGGHWQEVTPPDFSRGMLSIKFTDAHFEALVDNLVGGQRIDKDNKVPAGASGIMREAIEDQLRPVMETFKLVFKASRLQMYRFQVAYTAAYNAKRDELVKAGTLDQYHALSRADEEAIRKSLRDIMPAYPLAMTGGAAQGEGVFAGDKDYNGKFLVTTEKDGKKSTRNYQAESLVGGLRMDLNVRQYLSPGVKAAPLLTIGGGDATMMHILSMMGLDGTLNVYDGWEISIDTLSEKALAANEAVLQSWEYDLLGPVSESIQGVTVESILDKEAFSYGIDLIELGETIGVRQFQRENSRDFETRVMEALGTLQNDISHRAWTIKTNKKKLFTEHRISVDQMSGGENPATRNFDTVIRQPEPEAAAPIAGESAELVKRLGDKYQDGLVELGQTDLLSLLASFPFTNKVRGFVATRIAHLIPTDVRVFVGTAAQIAAKQEELFPGEELGDGLVPGVSYKGVAFLTVASEETLLHELVHVTTLHLVQRFYAKGQGLTAAQRDSVRELEKMLAPFLALPASNEALRSAQLEVRLRMDEGQPALAINEMLAWSLANEQIAEQLGAVEAPSVLKKVAKTIRALIRRLLGLPQNQQMESFLDQLSSNFQRLARRPRLADTHSQLIAFQRLTGPQGRVEHGQHLEMMFRSFGVLLGQLRVRTLPALVDSASATERQRLMLQAERELDALQNSGFDLSEREQQLFRVAAAVLGSSMALDPAVVTEMDKLFAHAMENIDESAFLAGHGNPQQALDQWNALFNDSRGRKDGTGRSVMLSNFVAMSLSHEGLRHALQQLEPPKAAVKGETFDQRLRERVSGWFDQLSGRAMGVSKLPSQKMVLDRLAWRLGELHTKALEQAARNAETNLVDKLEAKVKTGMGQADDFAERTAQNTAIKGWIRQGVQWSRGLLNEEQAGANAEMGLSLANQPKIPQVFTDLASELAGNTPSTVKLHRLVNLTKHAVSRVRQQLREEAPGDVRSFFTTALSPAAWAQLHKTVGNTDLQALSRMGMGTLKNVVSDAVARQAAIDAITAQLGPEQIRYEAEAQLLAQAMVGKDVAPRYRNAEALAKLYGQATVTDRQARRLTPLLDQLVSLYALEQLSPAEQLELGNLLARDPDGMQKLLNTMRTLVGRETKKGDQRHRINRWKGWVPGSADPRQQIVLANTKQAEELVKRGYKMVGRYSNDPLDPAMDLAYYAVNWVGGQATYNQGALQTVEGTLSGVDALTGQSLDPGMGTLIVNEGVVSSIAGRHVGAAGTRLSPIYNLDGDVVAYERVLDPAVVAKHTGGRKDLALSIGIWLGRQAEEELADHMNGQVVRVMADRWNAERLTTRKNEYVSINTSTDPVIADTWKAIPKNTQDKLLSAFGDKVMVRRDMIRNTVGYRSASIGDAFTGLSTLPQPIRKAIVDAVYVMPGVDYKKIVAAEKAIQGAVGTAKDWIVVRSGMVAVANGVANVFQLVGSGINPLDLPKLIARKSQETEIYLRNEKRLSRIRVELTATKRPDQRNRLLLEQQRLLDANSRLSIAPLIFAGELPTIAEGTSEHDEFTLTGDLMKLIEAKAEKLPQGVLTAAKILTISKDTAIYQGLNRLVQFGDFTAKAVLYDKWLAEGMSHEEALDKISERFVNYNLNAGRSRDYLESMGVLWFWNYKLRVQKIVMASIRENPLRFIMATSGAGLVGSDSLLTSFAPFVPWEYSIGPNMMFRAPTATLWHQLFN